MSEEQTTYIVKPWTGPILESETIVPVTDETINGWSVKEITTLEELREYFRPGSILRISNVRGFWLHVPAE